MPQRPAHSIGQLIARQVALWESKRQASQRPSAHPPGPPGDFITISRQMGAGDDIADEVAKSLGWHVFDREIAEYVAREADVRRSVVESLEEHHRSQITDLLATFLGRQSLPSDTYFKHLMSVILTVAHHGEAVIVGRGANFILPASCGLRVRLVASLPRRLEHVSTARQMSPEEACRLILESDNERKAFIAQQFHKDIDDPLHYDLVLNTGELPVPLAVQIIVQAFRGKLGRQTKGGSGVQG